MSCIFRSESVSHHSGEDVETVLEKASHRSLPASSDNHIHRDIQTASRDSFEEALKQKYQSDIYENSPDIESDIDKEELSPESPTNSTHSADLSGRSLPSNLSPYSGQISLEEAKLRYSLGASPFKSQFGLTPSTSSLSQFSDDLVPRRYSVPDSMQDVRSQSMPTGLSSQPSSPPSSSLNSPPLRSFRSPSSQSLSDNSFDDPDSRSLIPRIKEGLYFCHLCSFSGTSM